MSLPQTYTAGITNARETKTTYVNNQGTMIVTRKVRNVKLKTEITIDYSASYPTASDVDAITPNPEKNDNATGVIYDSRVQWNPITGKKVKTNIVRVAVGDWITISREEQQGGSGS